MKQTYTQQDLIRFIAYARNIIFEEWSAKTKTGGKFYYRPFEVLDAINASKEEAAAAIPDAVKIDIIQTIGTRFTFAKSFPSSIGLDPVEDDQKDQLTFKKRADESWIEKEFNLNRLLKQV